LKGRAQADVQYSARADRACGTAAPILLIAFLDPRRTAEHCEVRWKMTKLLLMLTAVGVLAINAVAYNSYTDKKVVTVKINRIAKKIEFKDQNGDVWYYEFSATGEPNDWAKMYLSMLLSAKSSGTKVTVYTDPGQFYIRNLIIQE
jgi:hypothetical protein